MFKIRVIEIRMLDILHVSHPFILINNICNKHNKTRKMAILMNK